jgi:signal transduction histidine kinase
MAESQRRKTPEAPVGTVRKALLKPVRELRALLRPPDDPGSLEVLDQHKRRLGIVLLSGAATIILLGFGVRRLVAGNLSMAAIDMGMAALLSLFVVLARNKDRLELLANLLVTVVGVFFLFLYIHGSTGRIGAIWGLCYPFLVLLLCGMKAGVTVSIAYWATTLLTTALHPLLLGRQVPYSSEFVVVYHAAYLMFVLLGVLPEYVRSEANRSTITNHQCTIEMSRRLEASNREIKRFLHVGSHHLQEPLRSVASFLQLIQRRYAPQLDKQGGEYIDFAVDGATWMKHLINDLVTYSTLIDEAHRSAPVDMQQVMHQVLRNLDVVVRRVGGFISFSALPPVMGDAEQLTRLLQDLVGNALKFHGDNPPVIEITAHRVDDTSRHPRPAKEDRREAYLFAVEDNGIGIPPEYVDRVFDVFEKLHPRSEYHGTGIGLAICRRIVEGHGGEIWAESAEGQGSTVFFTIPLPPWPEPEARR